MRIIQKYSELFHRLNQRQRTLVLVLLGVIFFSAYFNAVYKPRAVIMGRLKREFTSVNNRLSSIRSQIPDISEAEKALREKERDLGMLKDQLEELESKLPEQGRIPQILGDLVNQSEGYGIDFISIKPKPGKGGKEYNELIIEIKMAAAYSDFVNYLNRLESLSQFMAISSIVMSEEESSAQDKTEITLTLSILLGEGNDSRGSHEEKKQVEPVSIDRDPFLSDIKPAKKSGAGQELKVYGISSGGAKPTAIINEEVYTTGDMIEGFRIERILSDKVILSEGKTRKILDMEKE